MKAKFAPRITTENRTPLQDVIPLDTPYLVFIDPSSICNQKCYFCPTGHRDIIRNYYTPQVMTMETFFDIINQLREFPNKIKTIRLYKDGEPLLNPWLDLMIRSAKMIAGSVDFTTNGLLLNKEKVLAITTAEPDKIFISVPQNYDEKYIAQVADLYKRREQCHVHAKIIDDGTMDNKNKDRFLNDFGDICDSIFIENLSPCWPEFQIVTNKEMDKGIYDNEKLNQAVNVCPYIFYSMAINSDGSVSLCFLDWKHRYILGNVSPSFCDSLVEIWNDSQLIHSGYSLRDYQYLMLDGFRNGINMCANCQQLAYGMPDNIDAYAKQILERMGE